MESDDVGSADGGGQLQAGQATQPIVGMDGSVVRTNPIAIRQDTFQKVGQVLMLLG